MPDAFATNVFRCSQQPCNALQCNLICLLLPWKTVYRSLLFARDLIDFNLPCKKSSETFTYIVNSSCMVIFCKHASWQNFVCLLQVKLTVLAAKEHDLYSWQWLKTGAAQMCSVQHLACDYLLHAETSWCSHGLHDGRDIVLQQLKHHDTWAVVLCSGP